MSEQDTTPVVERPISRGFVLAPVTLLWMAAMLFSARVTITGVSDAETEVTSTAYAMPGAVSASLVGGAAVALTVLGLVSRRWSPGSTLRFLIATGCGLVVGLLGALSIITINTEGRLFAVVGGTIAAASTIGGALAGFRIPRVLGTICWSALGVFIVGFLLNLFQDPLLNAFGAGDSQSSQTTAAQWFSFASSLLSGLAAAFIPWVILRRARRRADGQDVPWPFYALAGAGPGLFLVIAEGLTRTAGARVLSLAGKVSPLELTVQSLLSGARFNNALIVLFVGAIVATIAVGRTLKPAEAPARRATANRPSSAAKAARSATAKTAATKASATKVAATKAGATKTGATKAAPTKQAATKQAAAKKAAADKPAASKIVEGGSSTADETAGDKAEASLWE